jgi:uncharacterized membrane protein
MTGNIANALNPSISGRYLWLLTDSLAGSAAVSCLSQLKSTGLVLGSKHVANEVILVEINALVFSSPLIKKNLMPCRTHQEGRGQTQVTGPESSGAQGNSQKGVDSDSVSY